MLREELGAAKARALLEEGANVVLTDVLDDAGCDMANGLDGDAQFRHVDECDEGGWRAVVDATLLEFNQVDVRINNASFFVAKPISGLGSEDSRHAVDVKLLGPYFWMKAVAPATVEFEHKR